MLKSKKYFWIAKTAINSHLAYFGEIGSKFIFLAVILYIFMRLWQVTYTDTEATQLANLSFAQMLWYLAVTESIILSVPQIAPRVDEDVRTGTLAVHLVKPMSYPLYFLSMTLAERLVRFSMNLLVGLSIAYLFVGAIGITFKGLLLFLLALPLAFVLDFLAYFLIGLGAFWLEDTRGLVLIYSRITMVLGGMLIPIELFPNNIQPILKLLPFSAIVYGPAKLFVNPNTEQLFYLLAQQTISIGILAIFTALIFQQALKRIQANGG